ncbi:MAG: glycoside hydrolase family 16 protein [Gaiellaceae bacterium]
MTHLRPRRLPLRALSAAACLLAALVAMPAVTSAMRPAPRFSGSPSGAPVLFDDFDYAGVQGLEANGWVVRTKPGWPGIPGASWKRQNVRFADDPDRAGNRILLMRSSTDGTVAGTSQTQICQQRKFLAGTYATRIRFRDRALGGIGGDHPVENFYTVSPLRYPMDPLYSELDFEYLPKGGWGTSQPALSVAAWKTFSPVPHWKAVNSGRRLAGSLDGWHTLVLQVAGGRVRYFVDGRLRASIGGPYYPRVRMSVNYNVWFIQEPPRRTIAPRIYGSDLDWVFHEAGVLLTPRQVLARVRSLRQRSVAFEDTVPAGTPSLAPACGL